MNQGPGSYILAGKISYVYTISVSKNDRNDKYIFIFLNTCQHVND